MRTFKVLVTGGSGYIGSHTTLALLQAGFEVVVIDNLGNSSVRALERVSDISGKTLDFVHGDVRDADLLKTLFSQHDVGAVLHFAGLKAVGESVREPALYFDNNVTGSRVLLEAMADAGVRTFIFSSSSTVYGEPADVTSFDELAPTQPVHPYGQSKLTVEHMLSERCEADPRWRVAMLRYFNPVGAHDSGLIGEAPSGMPKNLMACMAQVAVGALPELQIFGTDYPTPDGTCVRDYLHVMDVAQGHLLALQTLSQRAGAHIWNLGTGHGYSVLEMVNAFEQTIGRPLNTHTIDRRPGDVAHSVANPSKARRELGWIAKRDLTTMMQDVWRWQVMNPNGYADAWHQQFTGAHSGSSLDLSRP
jgi:UDP-glucose 4-epimerase